MRIESQRAQCRRLIINVQFVLSKAISMGGSTIRDFLNAEGKPGYFAQELLVYKKKYCTIHKKNLISNLKIAGRSSFYCDKCQKKNYDPISVLKNINEFSSFSKFESVYAFTFLILSYARSIASCFFYSMYLLKEFFRQ